MAFTDSRIPRPDPPAGNTQDVIPTSERNQDPATTEMMDELTTEGARPLTDEERKAADREAPAGQTVYAPASERVPVNPVPGHRAFVEEPARPRVGVRTAIGENRLWVGPTWEKRARQADKVISRKVAVDWQKRLNKLKDRWTPGRLEL